MGSMKTEPTPASSGALSRRQFIQSAAAATAAMGVLNAAPFVARGRVLGANDQLGIGFIGVGGRGSSHVARLGA